MEKYLIECLLDFLCFSLFSFLILILAVCFCARVGVFPLSTEYYTFVYRIEVDKRDVRTLRVKKKSYFTGGES